MSAYTALQALNTFTDRFREMCQDGDAVTALNFLQTEVSSCVDHQDQQETENFRLLLTDLLGVDTSRIGRPATPEEVWTNEIREQAVTGDKLREVADPSEMEDSPSTGKPLSGARFKQRMVLFESLMEFVSEEGKQPEKNLVDLFSSDILQMR